MEMVKLGPTILMITLGPENWMDFNNKYSHVKCLSYWVDGQLSYKICC